MNPPFAIDTDDKNNTDDVEVASIEEPDNSTVAEAESQERIGDGNTNQSPSPPTGNRLKREFDTTSSTNLSAKRKKHVTTIEKFISGYGQVQG